MALYLTDQEITIMLTALEDCRMKQAAKAGNLQQVQDLYSKLWDAAHKVREKPAKPRTFTK